MQPTLTKLLAGLVVQNSYGRQKQNGPLTLILKYMTVMIYHLALNPTLVQENNLLGNLEERLSCWNKIKGVLAFVRKFVSILKQAQKVPAKSIYLCIYL